MLPSSDYMGDEFQQHHRLPNNPTLIAGAARPLVAVGLNILVSTPEAKQDFSAENVHHGLLFHMNTGIIFTALSNVQIGTYTLYMWLDTLFELSKMCLPEIRGHLQCRDTLGWSFRVSLLDSFDAAIGCTREVVFLH